MLQFKFGGPINRPDADILFNRFVDIKKRSADKIKTALAGDAEAIRFYCGKDDIGVLSDLAFIFDKETLVPVITRILENKADGFILFNGARAEKDSVDASDVDGRPTLILFPYKEGEQPIEGNDRKVIELLLTDGEEHPGTGGSPDGDSMKVNPVTLPLRFLPNEYYPFI